MGPGLVGLCYGIDRSPTHVVLQGIAVRAELWRAGLGSRLLRAFEAAVCREGVRRISLGSSGDRPTEAFYLRNGYRARSIVLGMSTTSTDRPPVTGLPTPNAEIRTADQVRLEFETEMYDPELRDRLVAHYSAERGMFVFEKSLGP